MKFVTIVRIENQDFHEHDWNHVALQIHKIQILIGDVIFLYGQNDAEMSLTYVANHGYYISTMRRGEREAVAMDETLPLHKVKVVIVGSQQETPFAIFLREELALQVAHEFYISGKRSALCSWVDPFDAIE